MTDTASESWRHQTEAKLVASWPADKRETYLRGVAEKRGDTAARALRVSVEEMMRGNG